MEVEKIASLILQLTAVICGYLASRQYFNSKRWAEMVTIMLASFLGNIFLMGMFLAFVITDTRNAYNWWLFCAFIWSDLANVFIFDVNTKMLLAYRAIFKFNYDWIFVFRKVVFVMAVFNLTFNSFEVISGVGIPFDLTRIVSYSFYSIIISYDTIQNIVLAWYVSSINKRQGQELDQFLALTKYGIVIALLSWLVLGLDIQRSLSPFKWRQLYLSGGILATSIQIILKYYLFRWLLEVTLLRGVNRPTP